MVFTCQCTAAPALTPQRFCRGFLTKESVTFPRLGARGIEWNLPGAGGPPQIYQNTGETLKTNQSDN